MQGTPAPQKSLEEVLDDLCSRFIINLPEEELESFDRLCFQIEAAHWFYLDFFREEFPSLPVFNLKEFTRQMFQHCPLLQPYRGSVDQIMANFTQYKVRVPACGAIILNPTLDKCVLVKGWTNKSSWGFPKGKINKDEQESDCAIREVFEETSFDIGPYLKEEDHIELVLRETEQRVKLFVIAGVPEDTPFFPRTRKEISKISWFPLSEFKTDKPWKEAKVVLPFGSPLPSVAAATKSKNYFMVVPFVSKLKVWLKRRKHLRKTSNYVSDDSIVTAYDSSTNIIPPSIAHTTPSKPTPVLTPGPTPGPTYGPTSVPTPNFPPASSNFVPLPEPISLMHLLTPTKNPPTNPPPVNPALLSDHKPLPFPGLPLPSPYAMHPPPHVLPPYPFPPPQHFPMTPPHLPHAPFQTPPHHLPPTPQTYPMLPHQNQFHTPHGTPQPKTQPSSPYTPYPVSPPASPLHPRATSPLQMQIPKEPQRGGRAHTKRRVDFGVEPKSTNIKAPPNISAQNGTQKPGNAFTNFQFNVDDIMKCFVQL